MTPPATHKQSGIALIIVMIAITVLTMLTVAFAFTMKVETKLAQNSNSFEHLKAGGWNGGQYAAQILSLQAQIPNEPYDALNQIWAGGPGTEDDSNSPLATMTMDYTMHDGGKITVKIVDLERYININTANEVELRQAFNVMGMDAGDADTVISSILDWVQPGENPRPNGAKSEYYQGLTPPYYCKEAPMDDLAELELVKGVTRDMYWGSGATNHAPAAFQGLAGQGRLSDQAPTYACGLKDLFTPISTGRVNINTASELVLQAIPGFDANIASGIVAARDQAPLQSVGELINVQGMTQAALSESSPYIDVRSHTFEVTTIAEYGGTTQEFVTILGRTDPKNIKILSFSWKDREAEAPSPPQ